MDMNNYSFPVIPVPALEQHNLASTMRNFPFQIMQPIIQNPRSKFSFNVKLQFEVVFFPISFLPPKMSLSRCFLILTVLQIYQNDSLHRKQIIFTSHAAASLTHTIHTHTQMGATSITETQTHPPEPLG